MDVKRYGRIGSMVTATPEILAIYPSMTVYVEAVEFDRVTAERDALQLRLNAVEDENDRLRGHVLCLCAGANAEMHESWECTSYHPLLVRAVSDAEKELEKRP